MRLTDADAYKEFHRKECPGCCRTCTACAEDMTCKLIDEAPTVADAVIVTRCKDCKHLGREIINGCFSCAAFELPYCRPDDFCSKGIPNERAAV